MGESTENRWKRWLLGIVGGVAAVGLLLAAVVAAFWFGSSPRVPTEPMRLVRDASGRMVPADGNADAESGLRFEAQAGALEANNSFTFASMESRSGGISCSVQVDDAAVIHFLAQPIDAAGKHRLTAQVHRSQKSGK